MTTQSSRERDWKLRQLEKAIKVKVPRRISVYDMAAFRRCGRGEGRRWR